MDISGMMTHTYIIIGISVGLSLLILFIVMRKVSPMMKSAKNLMDSVAAANQLRMTGISSVAQVVGVQPTGTMINMMPVIILTLQVTSPSGSAYPVTIQAPVHQVHMPRIQPGQNVPVRIDPNNPAFVVLDL